MPVAAQDLVCAASSLRDVVTELVEANPSIKAHFAGSNSIARQIKNGAPCTIFISADRRSTETISDKFDARKDFLGNKLVLVTPPQQLEITNIEGLASSKVKRIAIGHSYVPAGHYAKQLLKRRKLFDKLKSRFVHVQNVRAVLQIVERGDADAGFVYRTDAKRSATVRVVQEFDENVRYVLATLRNTPDNFESIFLNEKAYNVFQQHGFIALFQP